MTQTTEVKTTTRCNKCFRVTSTDRPDAEAVCGCHITEPHRFVKGYGMRTCWECGKGGTAKIHRQPAG